MTLDVAYSPRRRLIRIDVVGCIKSHIYCQEVQHLKLKCRFGIQDPPPGHMSRTFSRVFHWGDKLCQRKSFDRRNWFVSGYKKFGPAIKTVAQTPATTIRSNCCAVTARLARLDRAQGYTTSGESDDWMYSARYRDSISSTNATRLFCSSHISWIAQGFAAEAYHLDVSRGPLSQEPATARFMMTPMYHGSIWVPRVSRLASQVGPESGGFWPPSSQIDGIDTRNFDRAL